VGRDADELLGEVVGEGAFERLREDLRLGRAVQFLIDNAVPISMEQAEARERLWTPNEEKVAPTPNCGSPEMQSDARRPSSMSPLIPMVIEQTSRGERSFDIYSALAQ